jgi:acyl-CoA synthetase (AMP-forming)/AMP-acid ligase II
LKRIPTVQDRPAVLETKYNSMVELLCARAAEQPDERAYVFLSDRGGEEASLTFWELERRADALAAQLVERGERGDRALLMFPPGLDFIVAFFGCLIAGMIAVPMMPPRRLGARDSSASIVADCRPRFALTSSSLKVARSDLSERLATTGLDFIEADAAREITAPVHSTFPKPGPQDLAFLQYTSGSTSDPKGVMVSHGNLLTNSEMIRFVYGNTPATTYVSWVPLYHDMGLILNVVQTLYVGSLCVLMAPVSFLQRPLTWLRAISDYRAEFATAPNFAFDLCIDRFRPDQMAGIDLSGWKIALNGAEPVRAETMEHFIATFAPYGFNPKACSPAYGLAEATLLASGGGRGRGLVTRRVSRAALQRHRAAAPSSEEDAQLLAGCGKSLVGEKLAIVDPETGVRLRTDDVGEIWISGPNIAQGYWQNSEATTATFSACIEGEADERWLRTGDLGFLDNTGELYITGRIKDVIIIRGINHYPQDLEETVQASHPALRRHGGAAFSLPDEHGQERLVVVQEVERTQMRRVSLEDLEGAIREAIATEHELAIDQVVLIRPGNLPKTTSGKIQRGLARRLFLEGRLAELEPALPDARA